MQSLSNIVLAAVDASKLAGKFRWQNYSMWFFSKIISISVVAFRVSSKR